MATFYLNRTNISGIIKGGPIGGKNQTGKYKIDSRFNKKSLIEKIEHISKYRDNIILMNEDANNLARIIKKEFIPADTFIFFDPPYYAQGKNLYMSFIDSSEHQKLFDNIQTLNEYKWIVTYDTAPEINDIYKSVNNSFTYTLNYTANSRRKAKEYLFANDNTIMDSFGKVELLKNK